jgi:hypothetical protein
MLAQTSLDLPESNIHLRLFNCYLRFKNLTTPAPVPVLGGGGAPAPIALGATTASLTVGECALAPTLSRSPAPVLALDAAGCTGVGEAALFAAAIFSLLSCIPAFSLSAFSFANFSDSANLAAISAAVNSAFRVVAALAAISNLFRSLTRDLYLS